MSIYSRTLKCNYNVLFNFLLCFSSVSFTCFDILHSLPLYIYIFYSNYSIYNLLVYIIYKLYKNVYLIMIDIFFLNVKTKQTYTHTYLYFAHTLNYTCNRYLEIDRFYILVQQNLIDC